MTAARLDPGKWHEGLLEIAPRVVEEFADVVFLWAGDGASRATLEASVRARGLQCHVRFLGYRTDIDRLLRAADLFVCPSHLCLSTVMPGGLSGRFRREARTSA